MRHVIVFFGIVLLSLALPPIGYASEAHCGEVQASLMGRLEQDLPSSMSMEELQGLHSRVSDLSLAEKRSLILQEAPEKQSFLWRLHLLKSLDKHELTESQCVLLEKISEALGSLASSGENDERTRAVRNELRELGLVARVVYPESLFRELFIHMGPKRDSSMNSEKVCEVLKDPELRRLVCESEVSE